MNKDVTTYSNIQAEEQSEFTYLSFNEKNVYYFKEFRVCPSSQESIEVQDHYIEDKEYFGLVVNELVTKTIDAKQTVWYYPDFIKIKQFWENIKLKKRKLKSKNFKYKLTQDQVLEIYKSLNNYSK